MILNPPLKLWYRLPELAGRFILTCFPSRAPRQSGNYQWCSNREETCSQPSCVFGICKEIVEIVGIGIHNGMSCVMNGDAIKDTLPV